MTKTTFHNGGMHNVKHSQAMLERGVCELAYIFFILHSILIICLNITDRLTDFQEDSALLAKEKQPVYC